MRKTLLIISLFVCTLLMAAPVGSEQARKTAADFMAAKMGIAPQKSISKAKAPAHHSGQADPYYIFNIENGGYVIVSGDDRTDAILGYSDHGQLDELNMPDNMRSFLADYADAIARLDHPVATAATHRTAAPRRIEGKSPIAPLLQSLWDQRLPYNALCPLKDATRCVTGCVATAMAQVMYYHKWPAATTAEIPGYVSRGNVGDITLDAIAAGTPIQWEYMTPTYTYNTYNGTQADMAVASLMLLCGQSVNMSYGTSSGAAASAPARALIDYFDYEETTVRNLMRINYSYDEWQATIYAELEAGRPVIYGGQSIDNGHSFVVDGYDKDDFFHINWGWSGTSNGYFRLRLCNPSVQGTGGSDTNAGYGSAQNAIIGIKPNDDFVVSPATPLMTTDRIELRSESDTFTRTDATEPFTGIAVVYNAWNQTSSALTAELGVRLADSNGNTLAIYPDAYVGKLTYDSSTGWRYDDNEPPLQITIPASLPDGNYRLDVVFRPDGSAMWLVCDNPANKAVNFTITGNTLTVEKFVYGVDFSYDVTGNNRAYSPQTITLNITNTGSPLRDDVVMMSDDQQLFIGFIELNNGESDQLSFQYTPRRAGQQALNIRTYSSDLLLGTVALSIEGSPQPVFTTRSVQGLQSDGYSVDAGSIVAQIGLTNTGDADFEGTVTTHILTYSNGGWSFMNNHASDEWTTTVAPGETGTHEVAFSNLSSDCSYALYYTYEVNGEQKAAWGDQFYLMAGHSLEITNIDWNAKLKDGKYNVDDALQCKATITITNHRTTPYEGRIMLRHLVLLDKTWNVFENDAAVALSLQPGESKEVEAIQDWNVENYQFSFQILHAEPDFMYWEELGRTPTFTISTPTVYLHVSNSKVDDMEWINEPVGNVTLINGDIKNTVMRYTADITNQGTANYDGQIHVTILAAKDLNDLYNGNLAEYSTYSVDFPLAAGETKPFSVQLDNPNDGRYTYYRFVMEYNRDGSPEVLATSYWCRFNEEMGISELLFDSKPTRVYNLKGLCVGTTDQLQQLPRGIYIAGGHTFVRK